MKVIKDKDREGVYLVDGVPYSKEQVKRWLASAKKSHPAYDHHKAVERAISDLDAPKEKPQKPDGGSKDVAEKDQ